MQKKTISYFCIGFVKTAVVYRLESCFAVKKIPLQPSPRCEPWVPAEIVVSVEKGSLNKS